MKVVSSQWTVVSKRAFGFALCAILLALWSTASAQLQNKVHRLGYLFGGDYPASEAAGSDAFKRGLRELGYIEGQNIIIEYRNLQGRRDRLDEVTKELVRRNPDAIVIAGGVRMVLAAKNATKTTPLIMAGVGVDPVDAGLVESLARPGGNVTGLTNLTRQLGGKRLELLKEAVVKANRVAVLYEAANPGSLVELKEDLPAAARALAVTIHSWELQTAYDLDKVVTVQKNGRLDALYVLGSPLIYANQKRIVAMALKSGLPSIWTRREVVDAGGLMYYGADRLDISRRAATYVDRILKGAKPADLPVQQPMKFELVINLKTAKQIGLTIPPNVLARADKVIR